MNSNLARALLIATFLVAPGCGQQTTEGADRPSGITQTIAADAALASGDEQRLLHTCTQVVALTTFLSDGLEDWPGSRAKDNAWYSEKALDARSQEINRLVDWVGGQNTEGFKGYLQILRKEQWVDALRDNGWTNANPNVPLEMTQARWQALENRLLLCASLSKGRVPDQQADTAESAPTPAVDLGTPPLIVEVQPE